ncbi:MAG: hypothetical protein HQL69_21505 [Magnetococcales bacterium]|nr:hypothetical protein [Magnetococcales bacterium]
MDTNKHKISLTQNIDNLEGFESVISFLSNMTPGEINIALDSVLSKGSPVARDIRLRLRHINNQNFSIP